MTMELQHLRDELMSRDSVVVRLREELVRLELHYRTQCPLHSDQPMQALVVERDSLYQELMNLRGYLQRNDARVPEGVDHDGLKISALEAELAESRAKCEALSASLRQSRKAVSDSKSSLHSEMTRLNNEVVSRDSIIARLREEMVRLEVARLRSAGEMTTAVVTR